MYCGQLPNGTILMNMRTKSGVRQFSWSHDDGTSWSVPIISPSFPHKYGGGSCEGSTVLVRSGSSSNGNLQAETDAGVLAFSTPNGTGRENIVIFKSTDGGIEWVPVVTVDPGPAAYSSLVAMDDPAPTGLEYTCITLFHCMTTFSSQVYVR